MYTLVAYTYMYIGYNTFHKNPTSGSRSRPQGQFSGSTPNININIERQADIETDGDRPNTDIIQYRE